MEELLHRLAAVFKFKEEWQLEKTGLSSQELFVLEHLQEGEKFRFGQFARKFGLKPSTLTGIIDRLEQKGLVMRKRDEKDRKAVYLVLTDKGRELVAEHFQEDREFYQALLKNLTYREKQQFLDLLTKILPADLGELLPGGEEK
ncbi:MarR family winged helix-turn-helix transcriptional regulator [Carboxydothermus hydrogenoformans]|uniref:Transcriptional regulator, MarR family n=1 Tax=Carboxydothermus hydrogenoformans (strain ATCC BAA-161 / DSM 6008 / Z-2901) TaxID=246194 RepID=Q3AFU6_CARHZ|nr:MarR family transcriptional regulator [Carboxydothermus hydrogenoformans]ABB14829.1 transcriptional regulator, MarR family [Carboxydothermus hydrogenoformans Z-2901]